MNADLELASVPRRLAAGLVSAVILMGPIAAGSALLPWILRRRGRRFDGPLWVGKERRPIWVRAAIQGASLAVNVGTRNVRGPGARLLRVRRVDLATGGPVTVRSALVADLFGKVSQPFLLAPTRRGLKPMSALKPELDELRRAHEGDETAYHEATFDLYRRRGVNPAASCLPALASILLQQALALVTPRRQTLTERLAGTVVIVEPAQSTR